MVETMEAGTLQRTSSGSSMSTRTKGEEEDEVGSTSGRKMTGELACAADRLCHHRTLSGQPRAPPWPSRAGAGAGVGASDAAERAAIGGRIRAAARIRRALVWLVPAPPSEAGAWAGAGASAFGWWRRRLRGGEAVEARGETGRVWEDGRGRGQAGEGGAVRARAQPRPGQARARRATPSVRRRYGLTEDSKPIGGRRESGLSVSRTLFFFFGTCLQNSRARSVV
jgi:hypothetical protein